jgi:hypothetical protein
VPSAGNIQYDGVVPSQEPNATYIASIIADSKGCWEGSSSPTKRLDNLAEAGYKRFLVDMHANLSIPTSFGRTLGDGCACRFCEQQTSHKPSQITESLSASKCFSEYVDTLEVSSISGLPKKSTYAVIADRRDSWPSVDLAGDGSPDEGHRYPCGVDFNELRLMDGARFMAVGDMYHRTQTALERCLTPNRQSPDLPARTLFLIGDSISGSFLSTLQLAVRGRYQVRPFFIGGLSAVIGGQMQDSLRKDLQYGSKSMEFIWDEMYHNLRNLLKEHVQADDLLVAHSETSILLDYAFHRVPSGLHETEHDFPLLRGGKNKKNKVEWGAEIDPGYHSWSPQYVQRLEQDFLVEILEPVGAKMLVLGNWMDPTWTDSEVQETTPPSITFTNYSFNVKARADELLQAMVDRHPESASFIDLLEFWCEAPYKLPKFTDLDDESSTTDAPPKCSSTIPGTNLNGFHDGLHVNVNGAIYMWPHICNRLEALGLS